MTAKRRQHLQPMFSMLAVVFLALTTACAGETTPPPAASTDSASADVGADASAADAAGADVGADVGTSAPRARVYLHDPVTDQGQTTEVDLVAPTSADGALLGPYADVKNCLNEQGGEQIRRQGIVVGAFCLEKHTALPNAAGSYVDIVPPKDTSDPNDAFAEVQMYHHMHAVHAYFKDNFGLTDLDYPFDALVNVNLYIEPKVAALIGVPPGWQGFPNAAFVPKEGFAAFKLPPREQGAIIFGQYGKTDLAYDASVIYHEYTHAMIGTTRLASVIPDLYGLDHLPGAMNEGFADYFAATMTNHPVIGAYGIAGFGSDHLVRDLSVLRRCPDDLTGEVHADGRILSSALWRIRALVGPAQADAVILRALQSFTKSVSLTAAGKLMVAEAEAEDADMAKTFSKILGEHGILDCVRVKPLSDWDVDKTPDKVALHLIGKGEFGGSGAFPDGVPAHMQFEIEVPKNTQALTFRWQADAQGYFGQPPLAIAINPGSPPSVNVFTSGINARAVLAMPPHPDDLTWQTVTLVGKCLTGHEGKLYVMPLNQGQGRAQVTRIETQTFKSMVPGPNVRTCD
jgi:hypothetical protein